MRRDTLGKVRRADELRHERPDLAAVVDPVAGEGDKLLAEIPTKLEAEVVRRDMAEVGLDPERVPDQLRDTVPGEKLIGSDVVGLTEGGGVAAKAYEGLGEVLGVGDRAEGVAVVVHQQGLAPEDAVGDGPRKWVWWPGPTGWRMRSLL